MKLEQFLALPDGARWRVFTKFDPTFENWLEEENVPQIPRPPKFDSILSRKGENEEPGFIWASECDLNTLFWYFNAAQSLLADDPTHKWAAGAEKRLRYWVDWRQSFPNAVWRGVRGDEEVEAFPPSNRPQWHAKEFKGSERRYVSRDALEEVRTSYDKNFTADEGAQAGGEEDDMPF